MLCTVSITRKCPGGGGTAQVRWSGPPGGGRSLGRTNYGEHESKAKRENGASTVRRAARRTRRDGSLSDGSFQRRAHAGCCKRRARQEYGGHDNYEDDDEKDEKRASTTNTESNESTWAMMTKTFWLTREKVQSRGSAQGAKTAPHNISSWENREKDRSPEIRCGIRHTTF